MIGDPRRLGKQAVPGRRAIRKIGRLECAHVEKALPTAGSRQSLEGISTMDLRCSVPERECFKL